MITKARMRRLTKRHLTRMSEEGNKAAKDAAAKILSNDTMKEALDVHMLSEFKKRELAGDKAFKGILDGDGETPILDWLWAHKDEILKFVLSIIALFAAVCQLT